MSSSRLLLAVGAAVMSSPMARAEHDLSWALAEAGGKQPIIVFVHALWCPPCNEQHREIWETEDGSTLLKDAVFLDIDAETDAGYAVVRRYGVVGYPTTLVLDPQGEELDRVEGYPGRDLFLRAMADARLAKAGLKALEAAAELKPDDPDVALALGQARLVRGDLRGEAGLRTLMAKGGAVGANAGRILGRYFLRVKRQGGDGRTIFRELLTQYAGTEDAEEFRLWAAQGLVLQGDRAAGLALVEAGVTPGVPEGLITKAWFMVRFGYSAAETRTAIEAAIAANPAAPGPRYLAAELALNQGDRVRAELEIRAALGINPTKALYRNFLEKRLGKSLK